MAVLVLGVVPVRAQFTGAFALNPPAYGWYYAASFPINTPTAIGAWTGTLDGFGSVYTTFGVGTFAGGELQLYMRSNGFPLNSANFTFLVTAPSDGTVSFSNNGNTYLGGAAFYTPDNTTFVALGNGTTSFNVVSGDTFGFKLTVYPTSGVTASVDVTNFTFTPAVPEPSTYTALLGLVALAGALARRGRATRPA